MSERWQEWKDLPTNVEMGYNIPPEEIFEEFPDGFRMSYIDVWNLGKPSMEKHWELIDALVKEHGGNPKAYYHGKEPLRRFTKKV